MQEMNYAVPGNEVTGDTATRAVATGVEMSAFQGLGRISNKKETKLYNE